MLLYSSLFQKFVNTFEILQLQGYKQQHRVSTTFSLSSAFSCASRTFKLSSPVSFSNLSSNSDSVNLNKKPDHTEFFCSWSFFFHIHSQFTDQKERESTIRYSSPLLPSNHKHWHITQEIMKSLTVSGKKLDQRSLRISWIRHCYSHWWARSAYQLYLRSQHQPLH